MAQINPAADEPKVYRNVKQSDISYPEEIRQQEYRQFGQGTAFNEADYGEQVT